MIKTSIRYVLIALLVLVVSVLLLQFWLLRTDSGARFLWARAVNAMPEQLEASSFSGNLRSGVEAKGVRYQKDGAKVAAGEVSFAIDPDLFGFRLNVQRLHLTDVIVQPGPAVEQEESSPSISNLLPSLRLPLTIRIDDLAIRNATLLGPEGAPVFSLDSLGFDATWDDALSIERLRFATNDVSVGGDARLDLDEPHDLSVSAAFDSEKSISEWLPRAIKAQISGNLQEFKVTLDSQAPQMNVSGTVSGLLNETDMKLLVTTKSFSIPPERANPAVQLIDLRLNISGSLNNYIAELETQLQSEYAEPINASATLRGDLQTLQVERLDLASVEVEARMTGAMRWSEGFAADAALQVAKLDPKRWLAEWPDGQFLSGHSELAFANDRLEISSLQVQHDGSEAALTGKGVVDTTNGILDVDVSWQHLQWPLAPALAEIDSRAATLSVKGKPDDWTMNGEIALGARDLPQGRFVLQGAGSLEDVKLQIKDSNVLGGRVVGQLGFNTSDGGKWSADLKTTNTRITPFVPAWPGQVSADFKAGGVLEPFAINVDIRSLSGTVREREVSAKGSMRLTREQMRFGKLQLQSGKSTLQLDGDWQEPAGVSFELASDALTDWVPAAAGQIDASGNLRAGDELPLLAITLSGKNVSWQQWSADTLEIRNEPDGKARPLGVTATAAGLSLNGTMIDSLDLSLQGSLASHVLELTGAREEESMRAVLSGGVVSGPAEPAPKWRGEVSDFTFVGRDELTLVLRENVRLELAEGRASLTRACLDISEGGAFCAGGQLVMPNQYKASIEMTEVPLNMLRSFSDTTLKFDQVMSGTMDLATGPRGRPSGNGRIDLTAGKIINEVDERLSLRTRAGFASFNLQEGQLLAGEINLPFSDAAEIAGTFQVADVAQGQASPIKGHLTAVIRDLGVGARILPQIDEAGGSLDADIRIDGTLAAPSFAGGFAIHDGRIVYSPLGFSLRDIELDSKILPGNRIELMSTFKAGEGSGRISSSADYLQGRSGGFEVSLAGENLSLIDLPDLAVVINPDLQLGIRGDDIKINGKVMVPAARISSVKFFNTGVSESDDVVYVGPVQPEGLGAEEKVSTLNYSGSVVLELGDAVVIDLDVAEARLRGTTTYRWNGPALPNATGYFGVSGKFEAYGQLLEISEGTIRYANVPASNPALRIRAEREIFGNSQVRRAGVLVSGTALRPKIEVYTNPATSTDRAVTLLVTGSDFNYEQGVGAVDVGTYIAPRLYASYGIGLFDRGNVISVRYDLSKGFGIKATSGKQAAGIDISYTIER